MPSSETEPRDPVDQADGQIDGQISFKAALDAQHAGRLDEAEAICRRILSQRPGDPEARHMLGIVELQTGRPKDALASFRAAIAADSANARYHNNLGNALLQLGQPTEAHAAFEQALTLEPESITALTNRGNAHMALGRLEEAARDYREVLAREPDNRQALGNLGVIFLRLKQANKAVDLFRLSLEKAPSDVGILTNLATALEMQNDLHAAMQAARQALEIDPAAPNANYILARLDHRLGRFSDAKSRLEWLLEQDLTRAQAVDTWFELGLVLDRLGAAEEALTAVSKGNALLREGRSASAVQGGRFLEQVRANRAWFTRERLVAAARNRQEDERRAPAFFVGFPRSGTTLVERVLAAHPEVVTTEEHSPLTPLLARHLRSGHYPDVLGGLTDEDLVGERGRFWDLAEDRHGALKGRLLVDKLPLNIVHLGYINLLFPDSPVIVALRDPRDVCLSCYMQRFKMNDAMVNFLDLNATVRTYRAVMGLWLHYRDILTVPWMEYRYEDLVREFEPKLDELLHFLRLERRPELEHYRKLAQAKTITTPSYRDVTSDVYERAVGRWRAYKAQTAAEFAALEPFAEAFGYPLD